MDEELSDSSETSDLTCSPLPFQSALLSYLPRRFDRSLIVPSKLSKRDDHSHSTVVQLPPLKISSGVPSGEEENFLTLSPPANEGEFIIYKQKFNRLRFILSQSYEGNRYTYEKVRKKKIDLRRTNHNQNKLIDHLLSTTVELNNKIKQLRDDISKQCHKRDSHEMRQLKFRRTFNHLNDVVDQSSQFLNSDTKTQLIEQYESQISQLKTEQNKEITHRDQQIEALKDKLIQNFYIQANEHTKLLRAIEQAFSLESEKCDILQECVDDYEANVYRAKKPCCLSTSYRLSKLSTQLRLYLFIESTLNELFHSSCSCGCGQFQRCHQTFMRLHNK